MAPFTSMQSSPSSGIASFQPLSHLPQIQSFFVNTDRTRRSEPPAGTLVNAAETGFLVLVCPKTPVTVLVVPPL